jgi:hypothetical protein
MKLLNRLKVLEESCDISNKVLILNHCYPTDNQISKYKNFIINDIPFFSFCLKCEKYMSGCLSKNDCKSR